MAARGVVGIFLLSALPFLCLELRRGIPDLEVAKQIFDTLEGWFSHFHSLSILWSAAMTIGVILIILYFLPVGIRILGASLRAFQTSIHELRLKNKEGGDFGDRRAVGKV